MVLLVRFLLVISFGGAVPKRGETLPDSAKMLLLFGRMAACTAIINSCAPDFYLGFWALRKA